ncbi:LysE family translocator [Sedimenticola selenatireducens]|uniref:LysE family translocator n=1 Tax=Sedimenticola selenatireducens TaxID=191960 RepID=UPI003F4A9B9B
MSGVYLNFILFAFIASITPGPSNLISLSIGIRQGVLAALPFIGGASVSMALILWFSGLGLPSVIVNYPLLELTMGWAGGLWISWIAWRLFSALPMTARQENTKPMGWFQGAGLQLINPKAWMMAISTIAIFSVPDTEGILHISTLAMIFFLIAIPCQLCWSWLGQSAKRLRSFSSWEQWINRALALVLLITVWGALIAY